MPGGLMGLVGMGISGSNNQYPTFDMIQKMFFENDLQLLYQFRRKYWDNANDWVTITLRNGFYLFRTNRYSFKCGTPTAILKQLIRWGGNIDRCFIEDVVIYLHKEVDDPLEFVDFIRHHGGHVYISSNIFLQSVVCHTYDTEQGGDGGQLALHLIRDTKAHVTDELIMESNNSVSLLSKLLEMKNYAIESVICRNYIFCLITQKGHTTLFKKVLKHGWIPTHQLWRYACNIGCLDVLKLLVRYDPMYVYTPNNLLLSVSSVQNVAILEYLLKIKTFIASEHVRCFVALVLTIKNLSNELIQALFRHVGKPDVSMLNKCLENSIISGHYQTAILLVKHGAQLSGMAKIYAEKFIAFSTFHANYKNY